MNINSTGAPGGTPVQYSRVGSDLAKQALDASDKASEFKDADTVLLGGLRKIAFDPNTTPGEKAIANLGIKMGNRPVGYEKGAKAYQAAAEVILKATAGSTANVLAQTAMNAYTPHDWPEARTLAQAGLVAVIDNPDSSEEQTKLAYKAIHDSNMGIGWEQGARIQFSALGQIAIM